MTSTPETIRLPQENPKEPSHRIVMDTLALLRHYSTEMVATYSEIQRLTQQLTSDAHLRQSEYEKIADKLAALNTTLAETKTVLHNFKSKQKTRTKTTKEIFIIISLLFSSLFISYESIRIFIYSIQ